MFDAVTGFVRDHHEKITMALVVVVCLLLLSKFMRREGMEDSPFAGKNAYNTSLRHHTTTEAAHGTCACTTSLAQRAADVNAKWNPGDMDEYETQVLMDNSGGDSYGDLYSNPDNRVLRSSGPVSTNSEDLLASKLHNS